MSKLSCFAFVICLPITLLSLLADSQPTVDENLSCGSTLQEVANVVNMIAFNQEKSAEDMKKLLELNSLQIDAAV